MNADFWKGKRALVTGCHGFLPSWVAAELAKRGAEVTGLTNGAAHGFSPGIPGPGKKIRVIRGSVTDYPLVKKLFSGRKFEFCFHLAARTDYGVCTESPLTTFETNIKGAWNVLEAARNCGTLRAVILASSDKVYGKQKKMPHTEGQSPLGRYPYDVSKICDELLGMCYFHTYGLPVAAARCANIYGGGDFTWSRVVPGTIRSVLRGETPLIRSDGTPMRDYLYVEDAVAAYLKLAEAVAANKAGGEVFNFSPENATSTLELIKTIITLSGRAGVEPRILGAGKSGAGTDIQSLSSEKAKRLLGWRAKYPLGKGLKKTLQWYIEYFHENTSRFSANTR